MSCRLKYLQVTSKFSFTVPRSLISTASVWGSGQNRSSISQDTLPTTTWLARLFSSVTFTTETDREVKTGRKHNRCHNVGHFLKKEVERSFSFISLK